MWFRLYFVYYHVVAFVMYIIIKYMCVDVCILSVYLYFEANETIKHIILTIKIHNYTLYWS